MIRCKPGQQVSSTVYTVISDVPHGSHALSYVQEYLKYNKKTTL